MKVSGVNVLAFFLSKSQLKLESNVFITILHSIRTKKINRHGWAIGRALAILLKEHQFSHADFDRPAGGGRPTETLGEAGRVGVAPL